MKRLFLTLLICLFAFCMFAGEMDVYVGYSFSNRNYDLKYVLEDFQVVNVDASIFSKGFTVGFNALEIKENKKMGLFTSLGFTFPSKIQIKEKA